jgi:hypothetical protein
LNFHGAAAQNPSPAARSDAAELPQFVKPQFVKMGDQAKAVLDQIEVSEAARPTPPCRPLSLPFVARVLG